MTVMTLLQINAPDQFQAASIVEDDGLSAGPPLNDNFFPMALVLSTHLVQFRTRFAPFLFQQFVSNYIIILQLLKKNSMHNAYDSFRPLLDEFELTEVKLGRGSFGDVFEAKQKGTQKIVAVKLMSLNSLKSAVKELRVYEDIQKELQHEPLEQYRGSFLEYYGFYHYNSQGALVIEKFGRSLETYLEQKGKPSQIDSMRLMLQICEALLPFKRAGILHRDLKPSNLLVDRQESGFAVKVCDLGLAQSYSSEFKKQGHQRVGTLAFLAPEVLQLNSYSNQSEIWSLGIVFYILIYGKLPYRKESYSSAETLSDSILSAPIKFKGLTSKVAKIGQACLALKPQNRVKLEGLIEQLREVLSYLQLTGESNSAKIISNSAQNDKCTHLLITNKRKNERKISDEAIKTCDLSDEDCTITQLLQKVSRRLGQLCRESGNCFPFIKAMERVANIMVAKHQSKSQLKAESCKEDEGELGKILQKMKIVCQFTTSDKDIMGKKKQFRLMESVLTIFKALRMVRAQNFRQATSTLKEYLRASEETITLECSRRIGQEIMELKFGKVR